MVAPSFERESLTDWVREKVFLGMSARDYVRSLVTPGNAIAAIIIAVGLPITFIRFTQGMGAVTNLSDTNPWGVWIAFDVLCGVALAAGGFLTGSAVHLFGMKEYKPLVRPAILTGFLGYALVVVGLLYDLGRPWRLPYPMMVSLGTTSVLFEVGWCVALYLMCQAVEMLPPVFEWLGFKKLRAWAVGLTVGATVTAVVLSTLHQSSLGALFLITPGKLHPLWYSMYLPVFFICSAIGGGIGMIVFESTLSHSYFKDQLKNAPHGELEKLTIGLGKAGAVVMYMNFLLRWLGIAHDNRWQMLLSGWGAWWLLEVVGFIGLPCLVYLYGYRKESVLAIRIAAVWSVVGLILNRFNTALIAFNYNVTDRYIPRWTEIWVSAMIITIGVLIFRWMVNRMPILLQHPDYAGDEH